MPRRKLEKRHIRNISKTRSTYSISIPIDIVRKLRWQDRQKVEVRLSGNKVIKITDWPSKNGRKK